jgi:mRNA interferase MazF
MRRGTIVWVNLEPASPPEFGKTKPGLVVSNSAQNEILDTVVVVPLSSRRGQIWPLRLRLRMPNRKSAYAVLPGIRQVHKQRLMEVVGSASRAFMRELDEALTVYLGEG